MNDFPHDNPPARLVAGALAHLAQHMTTGCPRAAERAAMLLDRVASDPEADAHLRHHARELVDILERERPREHAADFPLLTRFEAFAERPTDGTRPALEVSRRGTARGYYRP
jgi:hypothetical protein